MIQQIEMQPAYIDTVAVFVKDTVKGASIRMSVLNRHPSADWTAKTVFSGFSRSLRSSKVRVLRKIYVEIEQVTVTELYSDDLDATVSQAYVGLNCF